MDNSGEVHSYRLVFTEGTAAGVIEVEFAETCPDPAFNIARKACGKGEVYIFADDRLLARVTRSPIGYLILS